MPGFVKPLTPRISAMTNERLKEEISLAEAYLQQRPDRHAEAWIRACLKQLESRQ